MSKHERLFNGNKVTQHRITIGFELKEDAKQYYAKPHGIPVSLKAITKKVIDHMCEQGVLRETREDTEWAAPTFAVPQKMAVSE